MIRSANRKRAVCIGLICLNLAFIWGNSLLSGDASAAFSLWIQKILSHLLPTDAIASDAGHGFLRKLAHFSEFALLGSLFCRLLTMQTGMYRKAYLYAAGRGILTACIDEIIQHFVPGRHGCLKDVGIDTFGVITGLVVFLLIHRLTQRKNK